VVRAGLGRAWGSGDELKRGQRAVMFTDKVEWNRGKGKKEGVRQRGRDRGGEREREMDKTLSNE
jgi:hypothetical protein